jgi:hypothetical protein
MMNRDALLKKLNPDSDSLLIAISKYVDDSMLMTIARADYGHAVNQHFEALRQIRDEQIVFAPMPWYPKEVLELTRWIKPENPDKHLPPHTPIQWHTMRAFACSALLRAAFEPANFPYFFGDNDTIAPFLESLSFIDANIQTEALRFFAWCARHLPQAASVAPFYLLALLVLMLRVQSTIPRDDLRIIIDWIYEWVRAAFITEFPYSDGTKHQWLTWLTFYKQRHYIWQSLSREIAAAAVNYGNSEGRQNLKALARHLEIY